MKTATYYRALLRGIVEHYDRNPPFDAPGHGHSHRGVWDDDGTACDWCSLWNEVLEAIKEEEQDG